MTLDFLTFAAFLGLFMLVWDCVEVGRNDAANLVNAVYGARVMRRRVAVVVAGAAVVLGASFSSPVMETARKGIFDPTLLNMKMAMSIYISVYFVHTVLLYGFSGFGMPVSTTACLVFGLVGGSLFLAGFENVSWGKVGEVTLAIIVSIIVSGIAAFMTMRVFRGAIRDKAQDRDTVFYHGPWIAGAMFTWLTWFMVFKGLKNVGVIQWLKAETFQVYGEWLVLLVLWGVFTLLTHLVLLIMNHTGCKYLFHVTAVLGMICMAFAFGQNDLANAASPGLSALWLWKHQETTTKIATQIGIPIWALFGCGVLMASGMFTTYAGRVTRAEVNTGSQYDRVALYAPRWCKGLARMLFKIRHDSGKTLAPPPQRTEKGRKIHYDTLRASVITGVSASVIAFASGRGLPVSTTYVAFAAVIGTGLSDRVYVRGDADTKLGRAIWVITCWLLSPVISVVATGLIATIVYRFAQLSNFWWMGLLICFAFNISVALFSKIRADQHELRYHVKVGREQAAEEGLEPQPALGPETEADEEVG